MIHFYKDNRNDPVMLYITAEVNGKETRANFDTGAGSNVISRKMARLFGARLFDTEEQSMKGIAGDVTAPFAVVDSIRLGEVVYRNVPFLVADFKTDDDEANKKIEDMYGNLVIGNQMMFPLGEMQFDFEQMKLIIPTKTTAKPDYAPNFYYTSDRQIYLSVNDEQTGQAIMDNFDTGSSLTELTARYYTANEPLFRGIEATDTLRQAGMGGIIVHNVIKYLWKYSINNVTSFSDSVLVTVPKQGETIGYDALIGLPSIASRKRAILNFRDMWIKMEE